MGKLDLLGIGSIASAGVNLGQMISGWANARKGRKEMNSLLANRPQYEISKGYKDAFQTYQGLANQEMPGYQQMLGQLGQSSARATDAAERGAMGSNQYMSAVLESQDKEMEAIRNLGIMSSQWRTQQKQNLAGAQNTMGGLQDQQWDFNVNQPWQIKANMASERMGAGEQSGWQGLQGMASTAQNYFGTKYYADMMKSLYPKGPQNNGSGGTIINNDGSISNGK
jgi:hypothetical protein